MLTMPTETVGLDIEKQGAEIQPSQQGK